jgi:hypothetical protein
MRLGALLLCALLCCSLAPRTANATNCNFRMQGLVGLDEATVLRTLRCLVTELDKLQRENAALKKRLAEVEGVIKELPAPYSNVEGKVTEEPGRAIGKASFTISARSSGGASALPIEQRVLEEVCGKSGGCSVSVAFRQISLFDAEPKDILLTGPCQFTYAADTGAWSIGSVCSEAPASGEDGDQSVTGDDDVDPVLLQAAGGCLLSESEPRRAVGQEAGFARDHSKGLFLVAMPSRQVGGIRRFQCELVLN